MAGRARAACVAGGLAVVIVLGVTGRAAVAEPLPQERCEALIAELQLLEGGGAGDNITRGPEWARQNLAPEQLAYVKRLIEVREAVTFRCRTFAVVREPPPPSVAPADAPSPQRKPEQAAPATKPAGEGMPLPERRPDVGAASAGKKQAGDANSSPEPGKRARRTDPPAPTAKPAARDAGAAVAVDRVKPGPDKEGADAGQSSEKPSSATQQAAPAESAKPKAPTKQRRAKVNDAYVPAPGTESTFPRPSVHEP